MISHTDLKIIAYNYILDTDNLLVNNPEYSRKDNIALSLVNSLFTNNNIKDILGYEGDIALIYCSTVPNIKPSDSIKGYLSALPNSNAYNIFLSLNALDSFNIHISTYYSVYGSCSGSLQAIELADSLLKSNNYKAIIIIAIDDINEDIYNMFKKMRVLTDKECLPFFKNTTGFKLKESGAILVVTNNTDSFTDRSVFSILKTSHTISVGNVMPTSSSISYLLHQLLKSIPDNKLSAIISHGTATDSCTINESSAFSIIQDYLDDHQPQARIFAFKRYIGHTLAVSGILELLLYYEVWYNWNINYYCMYKENETSNLVEFPCHKYFMSEHDTIPVDCNYVIKLAYGMGGLVNAVLARFPL